MRGTQGDYRLMQQLIAEAINQSADQQDRPHHGFEWSRKGLALRPICANAPTPYRRDARSAAQACSDQGPAPMARAVVLERSWRQAPFTLDETNQAASGGPSRSVGRLWYFHLPGVRRISRGSPEAPFLSCPHHRSFKGGRQLVDRRIIVSYCSRHIGLVWPKAVGIRTVDLQNAHIL
jgi:hypothetical protein